MRDEIQNLFNDFETDTLCVADLGIVCHGTLVTHIHRDEKGDVQIWAGDMDNDKYAEELILNRDEWKLVMSEVLDNL